MIREWPLFFPEKYEFIVKWDFALVFYYFVKTHHTKLISRIPVVSPAAVKAKTTTRNATNCPHPPPPGTLI